MSGIRPRPRRRTGRLQSAPAIREAATALFLERGYTGTTMDEIAARAGVSKQTVYTHFADKERLFAELVLGNAGRADAFLVDLRERLARVERPEDDLRAIARHYLRFVIRPEVIGLRRLVIGEAARFPDLARQYRERVPARVVETFAAGLAALADRGLLTVGEPTPAAEQLVWLVLGAPLDRALFAVSETPEGDALDARADAAVRAFLALHPPPAPPVRSGAGR